MHNPDVLELRAQLAKSGIRQCHVAEALGITPQRMSDLLGGRVRLPEGFTDEFRGELRRLAEEKAEALRAEAERKAQQILAVVPAAENEAVPA